MHLYSKMPCLLYIENVRIKAADNEISDEEYAKLRDNEDFRTLVANGKFEISEKSDEEYVAPKATKALADMGIRELKKLAKEQGLELMDDATKEDIIELLKLTAE
jgi:hypothetical protein